MVAWPVLSCNAYNTSHLMGIVRTKRVYLRIPSIGERTCMIVPKKQYWVVELLNNWLHSFKQCCVCALTNTWNSEVNSFGPYYTHQMWCVICIAWQYWPCYHGQMVNMKLKSAHCAVLGNVVYVHSPILRILLQVLLSLNIPIKCDVLHALHDGIGDGIPSK